MMRGQESKEIHMLMMELPMVIERMVDRIEESDSLGKSVNQAVEEDDDKDEQ